MGDGEELFNIKNGVLYGINPNFDISQMTEIYISSVFEFEKIYEIKDYAFKDYAFKDSSSNRLHKLERVTLPLTLLTIGRGAFAECISLKEIVIPESVKIIRNYAFASCDNLEKVVINAKGLKEIGSDIFERCHNLKTIVLSCGTIDVINNVMYLNGNSISSSDFDIMKSRVSYFSKMVCDSDDMSIFLYQEANLLSKDISIPGGNPLDKENPFGKAIKISIVNKKDGTNKDIMFGGKGVEDFKNVVDGLISGLSSDVENHGLDEYKVTNKITFISDLMTTYLMNEETVIDDITVRICRLNYEALSNALKKFVFSRKENRIMGSDKYRKTPNNGKSFLETLDEYIVLLENEIILYQYLHNMMDKLLNVTNNYVDKNKLSSSFEEIGITMKRQQSMQIESIKIGLISRKTLLGVMKASRLALSNEKDDKKVTILQEKLSELIIATRMNDQEEIQKLCNYLNKSANLTLSLPSTNMLLEDSKGNGRH